MTARPKPPTLDTLDLEIIEQLRRAGRASSRAVAGRLKVNEATIATRLRRLEQESLLRVVALTDMTAVGYHHLAFAKVRVDGRDLGAVSASLAAIPEATSVSITTGRYDIIVSLLAQDLSHLAHLTGRAIPAVSGVHEVRWELALDIRRFESRSAALDAPGAPADPLQIFGMDPLDEHIIRLLQRDARSSNMSIASAMNVSEGTVRQRIRRLEQDRVIRIQAISNIASVGLGSSAFVGVHTIGGHTSEVIAQLLELDNIPIVIQSFGDFDALLVVGAEDRQGLMDLVVGRIAGLSGIRRTETIEIVTTAKHDFTWVSLGPDPTVDETKQERPPSPRRATRNR